MSRKLSWVLIGLLAIVLVMAACSPAATDEPTDEPTDEMTDEPTEEMTDEPMDEPVTVIIGTTDSINSLDFSDAYATHDWEIMRNTNVALMNYIPGTAEMEPGIAADWPVASDGGMTYTFTLDEGWMYPDGTEVVAADVVYTIERAKALGGDISGVINTYVDSVEAPDDKTVVFHLVNPRGDFPQIASMAPFMPTRAADYPEGELNQFPETVQGVGAYQVTQYSVEEQLVMERNPNFKDGFAANAPERVIIRYFQDATQMALAIENKEIDIAWRILGPPEVQRLSEVAGLEVVNPGGGGIRYLVPNHAMAPFDDINVRQAVAFLIDRDEIVDRVMQGSVDPLWSMVPPGFLGANETFLNVYGAAPDVAAADELLADSGYSADNPVEIDLWYPPEHYGTHAAQIFQVLEEQLEASELVNVTLQSQEWGTYIGALTGGEYPIGYLGWFFDYPDTSNYLDPFADSVASPSMGVNYGSDDMDGYLRDAGASNDAAEREQLYTDAQALMANDVVTIPLTIEPEFAVIDTATIGEVVIGPALAFQYELIVVLP